MASRVPLAPVKRKAFRKGVGAGGEKEAGPQWHAEPYHWPPLLNPELPVIEENPVVPKLQWALESPGGLIKPRFLSSPSRESDSERLDGGRKQVPRGCCCPWPETML